MDAPAAAWDTHADSIQGFLARVRWDVEEVRYGESVLILDGIGIMKKVRIRSA